MKSVHTCLIGTDILEISYIYICALRLVVAELEYMQYSIYIKVCLQVYPQCLCADVFYVVIEQP